MAGKGKPGPSKKRKAGNLQARFVAEYLIDRNGTEAAKRAGYAPASAGVTAYRLLKNPQIKQQIEDATNAHATNLGISAERVLQELARLAFYDPADLFNRDGTVKDIHDIPEDARRAISGLEIKLLKKTVDGESTVEATLKKIRLSDKKGSLDSLAKILGMLKERVEVGSELADALNRALERVAGER